MARLREMFDLGDDPAQLDLVATPLKGNQPAVSKAPLRSKSPSRISIWLRSTPMTRGLEVRHGC